MKEVALVDGIVGFAELVHIPVQFRDPGLLSNKANLLKFKLFEDDSVVVEAFDFKFGFGDSRDQSSKSFGLFVLNSGSSDEGA